MAVTNNAAVPSVHEFLHGCLCRRGRAGSQLTLHSTRQGLARLSSNLQASILLPQFQIGQTRVSSPGV